MGAAHGRAWTQPTRAAMARPGRRSGLGCCARALAARYAGSRRRMSITSGHTRTAGQTTARTCARCATHAISAIPRSRTELEGESHERRTSAVGRTDIERAEEAEEGRGMTLRSLRDLPRAPRGRRNPGTGRRRSLGPAGAEMDSQWAPSFPDLTVARRAGGWGAHTSQIAGGRSRSRTRVSVFFA